MLSSLLHTQRIVDADKVKPWHELSNVSFLWSMLIVAISLLHKHSYFQARHELSWLKIVMSLPLNLSIFFPPKVVVKQLPLIKGRKVMYAEDADNLIETIDDNNISKT